MTIESGEIILQMLQNKGIYPGDPAMHRIYSYTHAIGQKLYACFLQARHDDMATSPHVTNPILLMEDGELTEAGQQEIATLQNPTISVTVRCPKCNTPRTINVPKKAFEAWRAGEHIQSALHMLSADDREGLISGVCEPCWEATFNIKDADETSNA